MKNFLHYMKRNPHLWYLLFVPVFLVCFFALEAHIGPDEPYWSVYSPLDGHIPFVEGFVVPYYLWYPLLVSTGLLLLMWDVTNFKKYMQFLIIGFGAALVICFLVPNGQDLRPESFERDNVLTCFVGLMYRMDTNTNVFPSMHVIGSVAAAAAAFKSEKLKKFRLPWLILAFAISLSTMFIKQHSVVDVLGALVLCVPIYWWIFGKHTHRTD